MDEASDSDDGFGGRLTSSSDEDGVGGAASGAASSALREIGALRRKQKTDGFLRGMEAGKELTLQEGFDAGFRAGMREGRRLGELRGMLEALLAVLPGRGSSGGGGGGNVGGDSLPPGAALSERAERLHARVALRAGELERETLRDGAAPALALDLSALEAECSALLRACGLEELLASGEEGAAAVAAAREGDDAVAGGAAAALPVVVAEGLPGASSASSAPVPTRVSVQLSAERASRDTGSGQGCSE
jgi:hypothetical protein